MHSWFVCCNIHKIIKFMKTEVKICHYQKASHG